MSATPSPSQSGTRTPASIFLPARPATPACLTVTSKDAAEGDTSGEHVLGARKVALAISVVVFTKTTELTVANGPKSTLSPLTKFLPLMVTSAVADWRNRSGEIASTSGALMPVSPAMRTPVLKRKVLPPVAGSIGNRGPAGRGAGQYPVRWDPASGLASGGRPQSP